MRDAPCLHAEATEKNPADFGDQESASGADSGLAVWFPPCQNRRSAVSSAVLITIIRRVWEWLLTAKLECGRFLPLTKTKTCCFRWHVNARHEEGPAVSREGG